jgi:uncharacterized protein (TIGR02453 family)
MQKSVGKPRRNAENPLSRELFSFMRELRDNNDREWFKANRQRYEAAVQEPALDFIAGFAPHLNAISPHFVADARPVGGSLFRIYRDTRFSRDKTPYKTHTGIQFRHERGKDAHAPGFYLHLEPRSVFVAAGIWRPDRETLGRIRDAIAEEPKTWSSAVRASCSGNPFRLSGDSLKRPPAGYDREHPLIDDLKRKDFILVGDLDEKTVVARDFSQTLAELFRTTTPVVRFLCRANGMPF